MHMLIRVRSFNTHATYCLSVTVGVVAAAAAAAAVMMVLVVAHLMQCDQPKQD